MNRHKHKLSKKYHIELIGIFIIITLSIFIVSLLCVSGAAYFIVRTGIFQIVPKEMTGGGRLIIFMSISSAVLSLLIMLIFGKILIKPANRLIEGMNSLASGDYNVRMKIGRPFSDYPVARMITDSFNTMAKELQNTETLRSDFINNFSHEFKTPIVSIAGFAKLLRKGNLTQQQQEEYIGIIEEESLRLSYMAKNVLNLAKVENQTILSDISAYDLSEQLRSCLLLLEDKWSRKNLEMYIDFDEYIISANEELLKHVWINLIDNAVKFSPEYGILEIKIEQDNDCLSVSISNNGEPIPPEIQEKIFNKFYQGDESHSTEGNGIGLAIVKHIVELHHGSVSVASEGNITTFTVSLPRHQ